jgi:hypothetical protein
MFALMSVRKTTVAIAGHRVPWTTNPSSATRRLQWHAGEALKALVADAIPTIAEVQAGDAQLALEDLPLANETVKATPLVKQAVFAVLNREADGKPQS